MTDPPQVATGTRLANIVVTIVAGFFAVAAAFALFIAFTLAVPGTPLDGVWLMKPGSRESFAALGGWGVILMLVLALVLVVDAVGLFRRGRWARWLAVILLAVNVVPDAIRGLSEPDIFIPISLVAIIAAFLALPSTGRAFRRSTAAQRDTMNP